MTLYDVTYEYNKNDNKHFNLVAPNVTAALEKAKVICKQKYGNRVVGIQESLTDVYTTR